ncbi:MAG: hypothetical protein ACO2YV_04725, partial [Pseudomonadales bacterium]
MRKSFSRRRSPLAPVYTGRLGGFMAHSSRQRTRLSALGITRWRRRGGALNEEEPDEASANVTAEAQTAATADLAPELQPVAPEALVSSAPS